MIDSVSLIWVFILKRKRKYLSKDSAKILFQILLWLADFVMSAWLQSQRPLRLVHPHQSARIPKAAGIPFVDWNYFPNMDYSDWTRSPGLPSYKTDESIQ